MTDELKKLHTEIESLKEQNRILRAAVFGRKSEKLADENQDWLFNEIELYSKDNINITPEPEQKKAKPKKKKAGRKSLPANLPRNVIIHELNDDEKTCGCGAELKSIGTDTTERLDYIPARMEVQKHVRHKYACKKCEGTADESVPAVKMPTLTSLIPGSIATSGLIAHILTSKFCDALPFYRQEKIFKRLGVELSRANMCKWALRASEACQVLLKLMEDKVISGNVIGIDETTVTVLNEKNGENRQKSYMWLLRGGPPDEPVLLYRYRRDRRSHFLKDILKEYGGALITDGYAAYNEIGSNNGVVHAGCWAHARRKFVELTKASANPATASFALERIGKLYQIEKELRESGSNTDEIVQARRKYSKPIINELKKWLDDNVTHAPPKSLLGKAINYSLNQWNKLIPFLDDGAIPIDNNFTENGIRPFVIGRKNWLFAGNPAGANASAALYSIIETAKANGLEPYWYLRFLFELLPYLENDEEGLESLLPWNLSMQEIQGFFEDTSQTSE